MSSLAFTGFVFRTGVDLIFCLLRPGPNKPSTFETDFGWALSTRTFNFGLQTNYYGLGKL